MTAIASNVLNIFNNKIKFKLTILRLAIAYMRITLFSHNFIITQQRNAEMVLVHERRRVVHIPIIASTLLALRLLLFWHISRQNERGRDCTRRSNNEKLFLVSLSFHFGESAGLLKNFLSVRKFAWVQLFLPGCRGGQSPTRADGVDLTKEKTTYWPTHRSERYSLPHQNLSKVTYYKTINERKKN